MHDRRAASAALFIYAEPLQIFDKRHSRGIYVLLGFSAQHNKSGEDVKNIFLATLVSLLLSACATTPAVIEGSYLQSGPADRPLSEINLPSKDTCGMVLNAMSGKSRELSRCVTSSARFEYGFPVEMTGVGNAIISTRDQKLCETMRSSAMKNQNEAVSILGECRKL